MNKCQAFNSMVELYLARSQGSSKQFRYDPCPAMLINDWRKTSKQFWKQKQIDTFNKFDLK